MNKIWYTLIKENELSLNTVSYSVPHHKALYLDLCYLSSSSTTCAIQLNIVKYITIQMTQILLLTDNSLKKINRQVNCNLSLICHWLRANEINLNASKAELIIFKPKNKQIAKHLNFRISGQKINTCWNVKYLGFKLEENLIRIFTSIHLKLLSAIFYKDFVS